MRHDDYLAISQALASCDNSALKQLLLSGARLSSGIGGDCSLVEIAAKKVFVKEIRLTEIERANLLSTANLFDLPMFYQYRLGSAGFGAFREQSMHVSCNKWILNGQCQLFPLLYHWQILPTERPVELTMDHAEKTKSDIAFWNNSEAVGWRLQALQEATFTLVLFLEFTPVTLFDWLAEKIAVKKLTDTAVKKVEAMLNELCDFMQSQKVVHFDCHFQNIFVKSDSILLGDFGLALSASFDITEEESEFLHRHKTYDRCVAMSALMKSLVIGATCSEDWRGEVSSIASGEVQNEHLTPYMVSVIKKFAPAAIALSDFYEELSTDKSAVYPDSEMAQLLFI